LTLKTYRQANRIVIDVADTGTGIPSENMSKIFEPFFTTKEVGKGTGLGLSVCYGIISEHGGRLSVRSNPGRGTTFSIFLPVVQRPGTQTQ
jgi:two-component system NtrC family sensor kinase